MRKTYLTVLLLAASSFVVPASASPVITAITPNHGPVTGGTKLLIHGTGFSFHCVLCSPPFADPTVTMGGVEAQVHFVDSTLLEVTTPAHAAGTVDVTVEQRDGSDPNQFTLKNGFTFVDEPLAAYEPILFPIFMPPIPGAFGSEFHTEARVIAKTPGVNLFGLDMGCTLIDPPIIPTNPFAIGTEERVLPTTCSQSVGRIFYVPPFDGNKVAASLRVSDVTRQAESHGVEIPVVRRTDFRTDDIMLLNVPIDRRYRNTLRIYGLNRGHYFMHVTFNGRTHNVTLSPGSDIFTPAFATFTDFPLPEQLEPGQKSITVRVGVMSGNDGLPIQNMPFWAFISVTNNDTQHITTITPN